LCFFSVSSFDFLVFFSLLKPSVDPSDLTEELLLLLLEEEERDLPITEEVLRYTIAQAIIRLCTAKVNIHCTATHSQSGRQSL